MRQDIQFNADHVTLRGWLYRPSGRGPHPLVVMCHGFSAVKEMGLDDYAAVFCAAGLAVLVYDNRNLGASDGEPRQDIDPIAQRRDYSHAVSFAATCADIDPARIGAWGTSYSGGLAIVATACDRRIRCVVAQVPYLDGFATMDLVTPLADVAAFHRRMEAERAALAAGALPARVAVCSDDGDRPEDSPGRLSWRYFNHFVTSGRARWENSITLRSLDHRLDYDAMRVIERVAPTPLMMIVADADDITPTRLALEAFGRAHEPKRLVLIPGHHYRPYLEDFARASHAARDWFLEHL